MFGRRLVSGAADWRKTIPAFFCIVHGNEAVRAPREQLALMPERGDSPAWDSSDRDSKQCQDHVLGAGVAKVSALRSIPHREFRFYTAAT